MDSPRFTNYLGEIGPIPLLTSAREAELGRTTQIGLRKGASLRQKRAAQAAQQELICGNLKLVVSIARNHHCDSLGTEDMTFEGNLGLATAARRYDPIRFKARFSTYATLWIREYIRRAIQRAYPVHFPTWCARRLRQIRQCHNFLEDKIDQDIEMLHLESGISKRHITLALSAPRMFVSLDAPAVDEFETGIECAVDSGIENPRELMIKKEQMQLLRKFIPRLDVLQQKIIRARFGYKSDKRPTLAELGGIHGFSDERIRQLEIIALRKLRRMIEKDIS